MMLIELRRRALAAHRRYRETRMVATAFRSDRRPILAHIVPIRRCNLSCTYCNEFDDHSTPVSTDEMLRRVDRLAELGTAAIHISGGEPLLHPDLDVIIRRIRERGMQVAVLTNGYLLTVDRVRCLNRAGLDQMQISVDNVAPDDVSKKSLKVLDRKLVLLREHATFEVNVNAVLGSDIDHPQDALVVARRARELGFTGTVGVLHDEGGQVRPLDDEQLRIHAEILREREDPFYSFAHYSEFQENIIHGRPNRWTCRAGGRYLYVCENGLVHWCSQQRGRPAIPLGEYGPQDLEREGRTEKQCAPYCTVSCVHRVAVLDRFREQPIDAIIEMLSGKGREGSLSDVPLAVRLMAWAFVRSSHAPFFRRAAMRVLGMR